MPTLTIEGKGSFEVEQGTRLVNAIEDAGVNILHRCGGFARCTTCRVVFLGGEPGGMTAAEKAKLKGLEDKGIRLSCQILVQDDMTVRVLNTLESTGLDSPGNRPEDDITPEPEWVQE